MVKRVRTMSRWTLGWLVVAGIIGAYLVYSLFAPAKAPESDQATAQPMLVTVVKPHAGELLDTIEINGTIRPRNDVVVTTELATGGAVRVAAVMVEAGTRVNAGTVLAKLDDAELQNTARSAAAELARAEAEFRHVEPISNTGAISREAVMQRQTAYETARAAHATAQLNVQRATIKAPVAGVVYERNAAVGQLVGTSDPLFRMARGSATELVAQVPEAVLPKITEETPATVTLLGHDGETEVSIRVIAPSINPSTRTAEIRLTLPADRFMPIGTYGRARLMLARTDGQLLPLSALQYGAKGPFVWGVTASNTVVAVPVSIRQQNGTEMVIDPLPQPYPVVAKAGAFLQAGDAVSILQPSSSASATLVPHQAKQ
jgi:RND family efflux transporter MFP subunit